MLLQLYFLKHTLDFHTCSAFCFLCPLQHLEMPNCSAGLPSSPLCLVFSPLMKRGALPSLLLGALVPHLVLKAGSRGCGSKETLKLFS